MNIITFARMYINLIFIFNTFVMVTCTTNRTRKTKVCIKGYQINDSTMLGLICKGNLMGKF